MICEDSCGFGILRILKHFPTRVFVLTFSYLFILFPTWEKVGKCRKTYGKV